LTHGLGRAILDPGGRRVVLGLPREHTIRDSNGIQVDSGVVTMAIVFVKKIDGGLPSSIGKGY
jgi:hypothetical protein